MRATTLRWTCAAAISAGVAAFASATTHAAPGKPAGRLVLTSFLQRGRTDVRRNEVLEFRLSAPLREGSVDWRTLQVNAVTAGGRVPAIGARIVKGNSVQFDPRRTQRNYDAVTAPNGVFLEVDHWEGFAPFQAHEIRLPASALGRTLHDRSGRRLDRSAVSTFTTSGAYDDPVPGQPSFIGEGGTGLFGFDPPRSGASGLYADDASLVIEFSEPILESTLDLASTVLVTLSQSGATVPGNLRADPSQSSGRRFLFDPAGGWAAATSQSSGGYVQVQLTTGITDLAGNPLKRPVGPAVVFVAQ